MQPVENWRIYRSVAGTLSVFLCSSVPLEPHNAKIYVCVCKGELKYFMENQTVVFQTVQLCD